MDSFEWNKIAGALLFALLIWMGLKEVNLFINPEPEAVAGYEVPGVELSPTATAEAPKEVPFAVLLAQGSVEAGRRAYNKCKSCHTIEEGGRNGTGPNLWDTVGNVKGHIPGFNYSSALLEKGGTWTYEALDAWLKRPAEYIPGNRMAYGGIRNAQERADLILYMREYTPNPPPLPTPPPPEEPATVEEPATAEDAPADVEPAAEEAAAPAEDTDPAAETAPAPAPADADADAADETPGDAPAEEAAAETPSDG